MSMAIYHILVVDDEPEFHKDLSLALGRSFIFEGVLDYITQLNQDISIIPPAMMDIFLKYDWPGNIRELVNTIESMLIRQRVNNQDEIGLECLPDRIQKFASGKHP